MLKSVWLTNASLKVKLLNYGARIAAIDFDEQAVTLCYQQDQDFLSDQYYLGASVGPIANRIGNGKINISGKQYQLPQNESTNCLHSGGVGLDKLYWQISKRDEQSIEFNCCFDLTKIGLVGELSCTALYQITDNALKIRYSGQCTKDTYLNLTNHVYFNLNQGGDVNDYQFNVMADSVRECGTDSLPNGNQRRLEIPCQLNTADLKFKGDIDHHFDVQPKDSKQVTEFAHVSSASSNISLRVLSNAPGFQLYTGAGLNEPFSPRTGFCIEPQYAPNAINTANDYSPILVAGETSERLIEYRFSHEPTAQP